MSLNKRLISTGGVTPIVASEHFQMVTWNGNGVAGRSITGVGFQPDVVFVRRYNQSSSDWILKMSKDFPSTEWQEWNKSNSTNKTTSNHIQSLDSDGFTVGNDVEVNSSNSSHEYIAYCWKINGNSANPDVNPITKMSQRSYTGTGSTRNLTHGMGTSDVTFCIISTGGSQSQYKPGLHTDQSATTYTEWARNDAPLDNNSAWNDTAPTSTNFTVRSTYVNYSGQDYVFWGMTNIDGFSKFGSYTGNGSTSGPTITTGFQPGLIWIRRSTAGINMDIVAYDVVRSGGTGVTSKYIDITDSGAQNTSTDWNIDITSTGFQIQSTQNGVNASGATYFYWVWADPTI